MPNNADKEVGMAQDQDIAEVLRRHDFLPPGYQFEVHLHRGNRKKRRDAAFEQNWDPDIDSIRISFTPMEEGIDSAAATTQLPTAVVQAQPEEDRMSDLLRALDRAERRPGYEFISLKWFRDTALITEGYAWAANEGARHDVLREAIDRRWLLTSKVANPRPPNYPVTAVRLNRQMPEVNAVIGGRTANPTGFRPIPVRGEPLSMTVLRDRR